MKKVGIYTTFYEASSGYSLIRVAETQIQMLLDNGYDPAVYVQENFEQPESDDTLWRSEAIDLRRDVPQLQLVAEVPRDFETRVDLIYNAMVRTMSDLDVCITHDIIAQEYYMAHNAAMRRYAKERPELLWLHWIHSVPRREQTTEYPQSLRSSSPPGYIVYPNSAEIGVVCKTYGLFQKEHKAKVSRSAHALDPLKIWRYDKLTRDLATKADLLGGEVSVVYPARLDRGKQVEKIIRLMIGVQLAQYEPRLLVVDWQSSGERFQAYIEELIELAASYRMQDKVHFTSRLDDRCSQGVPPRVVVELMDLANVGIFPSKTETYSIVVHENINRRNLTVLNHDLAPMRELYGDHAIYMDFGSDTVTRKYQPSEQAFWNDQAKRMIAELRNDRALWAATVARREWTPKALWKDFERLLYLESEGE